MRKFFILFLFLLLPIASALNTTSSTSASLTVLPPFNITRSVDTDTFNVTDYSSRFVVTLKMIGTFSNWTLIETIPHGFSAVVPINSGLNITTSGNTIIFSSNNTKYKNITLQYALRHTSAPNGIYVLSGVFRSYGTNKTISSTQFTSFKDNTLRIYPSHPTIYNFDSLSTPTPIPTSSFIPSIVTVAQEVSFIPEQVEYDNKYLIPIILFLLVELLFFLLRPFHKEFHVSIKESGEVFVNGKDVGVIEDLKFGLDTTKIIYTKMTGDLASIIINITNISNSYIITIRPDGKSHEGNVIFTSRKPKLF
ncbi:MAG: hypothetical protein WC623_21725 [Pedobacter sp.]|uniref:hypothetical protein n=1 Tax=Pedobacter sp. TaxID=1411316 RepID=UPI00356B1C4E